MTFKPLSLRQNNAEVKPDIWRVEDRDLLWVILSSNRPQHWECIFQIEECTLHVMLDGYQDCSVISYNHRLENKGRHKKKSPRRRIKQLKCYKAYMNKRYMLCYFWIQAKKKYLKSKHNYTDFLWDAAYVGTRQHTRFWKSAWDRLNHDRSTTGGLRETKGKKDWSEETEK